jgi:hypothetical protein
MPVRKNYLTRSEQEAYLQAAQELCAQRVPIYTPEEWEKHSRCFEISIAPVSTIDVRRPGVTYYTIYIQCTALQNNSAIVDEFEITAAWDDDITAISSEEESYRFGGLDFARSEVLNHRLEARIRFPHIGDRIEGWLLAQGIRPVPAEYGPRHPAPFELSLWDSLGHIYSTHATAVVDRSAEIREMHAGRKSSTVAKYLQRELGGWHYFSGGKSRLSHSDTMARPNVASHMEGKLKVHEKQSDV